jgi:hypothetical protein
MTDATTEQSDLQETPKAKKPLALVIGYTLLGIHIVMWYPALAVPFLPIPVKVRAALAGGMFAVGEIAFWVCLPFLGREFASKYRRWFDPRKWFRKKAVAPETETEIIHDESPPKVDSSLR